MRIIRYSKLWYLISLLVIVPGIISLLIQGLNLGIDFQGGIMLELEFPNPVSSAELRSAVESLGQNGQIQLAGEKIFILKIKELPEKETQTFIQGLEKKFPGMKVNRNEIVSGVVGKELTAKAIYALTIAGLLMIVYITIRFELYFGIAAVLALVHDVLVTIGLFSIFRWEVDSTFIAAILTIVGYSINDTIVIFDRIRENLKNMAKEPLERIVDVSIRETIVRSLTTGMTVIIGLIALLVFGGESTKNFTIAMLIGCISGSYSSIFCASPIWYSIKTTLAKDKSRLQTSVK